jgi:hypothetical protein
MNMPFGCTAPMFVIKGEAEVSQFRSGHRNAAHASPIGCRPTDGSASRLDAG